MRAVVLFLSVLSLASCNRRMLRCGQAQRSYSTKFYFAAPCSRSTMTQVAATYSSSLEHCKQYAARRRGLALNFVHRALLYDGVKNYSGHTCLVFDCPEFDVQMSYDTDTVFDYYTTYARSMPTINATCLPRQGLYLIHNERRNFTEAQDICESEDGYLADISKAPKSVQLGSALSREHIKRAFIGLSQVEGRFLTSIDMPLDCIPYRAWAPGEPKDDKECATLSNRGTWFSANCSRRMPFVCELRPSGPMRPCIGVSWRWKKACKENVKKSFPNQRRYPKCGDPSIDEKTFKLPVYMKRKYEDTTERRSIRN